jgi:outer membrane protein OmpA-like peptidoglycan-associated protein
MYFLRFRNVLLKFIPLLFVPFTGYSFENAAIVYSRADSIIKIHGYVYDTVGEKERNPVKAKLIYESNPYGSEIGIISTNDTTGYYEFYLDLGKTYSIHIQSDTHGDYMTQLVPAELIENGEIRKDFYLLPEIKENQVIRLKHLIFEQGKSKITSESYQELDLLADFMRQNEKMIIQLEGHTDFRGSKKLNYELSQQRVDAVKHYLIQKGIQPKRIKTKAFGGTQPLTKEKSIEAATINRRVEVRILKLK